LDLWRLRSKILSKNEKSKRIRWKNIFWKNASRPAAPQVRKKWQNWKGDGAQGEDI